jgi:hypothetical protein
MQMPLCAVKLLPQVSMMPLRMLTLLCRWCLCA